MPKLMAISVDALAVCCWCFVAVTDGIAEFKTKFISRDKQQFGMVFMMVGISICECIRFIFSEGKIKRLSEIQSERNRNGFRTQMHQCMGIRH